MLELSVLIGASLINVLLISAVLASNQKTAVHKYFGVFTGTFTLWAIVNYLSLHPVFFSQLTWIRLVLFCGAILSTSLLLFVLAFPNDRPRKAPLTNLIILGGAIAAFSSLTPLVFTGLHAGSPVPGPAIPLFGIFAVGYIILSSVVLVIKSFRGNDSSRKTQARLAAVSLVGVFALIVVSNFILPSAFRINTLLFLAPFYGVILSLSFTYSILKYHLFDLRVFAARAVAYILSLITITVIFSLVAYGLAAVIFGPKALRFSQQVVYILMAALLAIVFGPIKSFFDKITDAFFFRHEYNPQVALDKLGDIVTGNVNAKAIASKTLAVLNDTLKSEFITLVIVDSNHTISLEHTVGKPPKDVMTALEVLRKRHNHGLFISDLSVDRPLTETLLNEGIAVGATLLTNDKTIGYLFMGVKVSGQPYNRRDRDFIAVVVDELAVAMQNALRFQEIRAFNQTLQQKIDAETRELKLSNQKLQHLDESKDEFISMASHQLRTPLTSVKGYLSMVLEGDAGTITEAQRKLLEEAFAGSQRMAFLIGDFLNVSRLRTGKFMLEKRSENLAKVIGEAIEQMRSTATSRSINLAYTAPAQFPDMSVDAAKISQAVINFIDNAIYYSPEGSTINIELTRQDGHANLKVKDNGIGIPKSEQHQLFTKFFRATNARKVRPDGTGIGLFMAKKVIIAHGGSVIFESKEGKGSTFGFSLPL